MTGKARTGRRADDEAPESSGESARRRREPFDVMRSTRALAPHDPKLNDLRWLIGDALRRVHRRARFDPPGAAAPPQGLPASEAALYARDKLRAAEIKVGPAAWPIVARIVFEGAEVSDCRGLAPEIVAPWRADAVVVDRLRVALDRLSELLGVTPSPRTA